MASGKEIRTKIASVKSTQKITKAMEMVAVSKLRRTQDRMAAARPYAERIKTVIGHLSEANPDYRHPYLHSRDVKRVGYIVISTDKGLCGGLNVNTFREVIRDLRKWQEKWIEVLVNFVQAYAKAEDTADALNQIAVARDYGGKEKEEEAKRWYQQLVTNFPTHPLAAKARGCIAREAAQRQRSGRQRRRQPAAERLARTVQFLRCGIVVEQC